jgi:SAM-dependent methyltransferase
MKGFKYILGDSDREVKRLAFQAGVWRDMTEGLFDRHKVGRGWKVLEAGAGTGTVFFPLAERVKGRGGEAHAVERSPAFADYLRRGAAKRRLSHAKVFEADILDAPLPESHYDLIFARWVFLFLPRVEAHLRKLARSLKRGGLLAIEDYHRDGIAMYPPISNWAEMVASDKKWFASQGGDLNVAGRLPGLFRKAGLELVEVVPRVKAGRPGSDVWNWAEAYFVGYVDKIAAFPPLGRSGGRKFKREWLARKRSPDSLLISPTMLDVVGRRKS